MCFTPARCFTVAFTEPASELTPGASSQVHVLARLGSFRVQVDHSTRNTPASGSATQAGTNTQADTGTGSAGTGLAGVSSRSSG